MAAASASRPPGRFDTARTRRGNGSAAAARDRAAAPACAPADGEAGDPDDDSVVEIAEALGEVRDDGAAAPGDGSAVEPVEVAATADAVGSASTQPVPGYQT